MKANLSIFIITFLGINLISLLAQKTYFPPVGDDSTSWEKEDPVTNGWDLEALENLSTFADTTMSKALIVLHKGKIVIEDYYNGHDSQKSHYWASAGKTLTAFLTGLAIDEGLLTLDTPTSEIMGEEWTSCLISEEKKRTIWHHLTMTTALNEYLDWECSEPKCFECIAEPGTRWSYHQGAYTLMIDLLQQAYSVESINSVVLDKIGDFTGIYGAFIKVGNNRLFFSNARSFARFGLLLQNNGDWDGHTILQDKSYFASMISSSQSLNKSYGYLTWINGQESYMLPLDRTIHPGSIAPSLPAGAYAGIGANGQIVCVVPEWDLVFIRMGDMDATDYAPVDYLELLGAYLAKAIPVSSVYANENIELLIENGYATHTSQNQELILIDYLGRVLEKGNSIKLKQGNNIIMSGGKIHRYFLD